MIHTQLFRDLQIKTNEFGGEFLSPTLKSYGDLSMGYQYLAYAIIAQAVKDYKRKIKKGEPVDEIVEFFNSKWCEFLCVNTPFGESILHRLKKEYDGESKTKHEVSSI